MNAARKHLLIFVIILLVVVASRGLLWLVMGERLRGRFRASGNDYRDQYLPVAASLVEGRGLVHPKTGRLYTKVPPGYPAYLAGVLALAGGVGLGLNAARLLVDNLLLVPLTIVGLVVLWRILRLELLWAVLAALAFAVYPPYVWGTMIPVTMPLATLLLVWTFVAWAKATAEPDRARWHCTFGIGLGLCMLVRPSFLLLPVVAIAALALRRHNWRRILCAAGCMVVLVGPWIVTASRAEGRFVPLSTAGVQSVRDGMSRFPDSPLWTALRADEEAGQSLPRFVAFACRQLVERPGASLSLWGRKLLRAWYATDAGGWPDAALAAMNFPLLLIGMLGWLAWRLNAGDGTAGSVLRRDMVGVVLYFWLLTVLVLSILRYMTPVMWAPIGCAVLFARRCLHAAGVGKPAAGEREREVVEPMRRARLSIVMPAYNEEPFVRESIERVLQVPLPAGVDRELIVVNDGSGDGTGPVVDACAAEHPATVRAFHHSVNRGKGAALRTGFQHVTGDIVIIQDADLELDPSEYPGLLKPILAGRADVVYGSRFLAEGRGGTPLVPYLANRFLTFLTNLVSGLELTDMETCYKVFRRSVLDGMVLKSDGFGFEPEFTVKMARKRPRLCEVPVAYNVRGYAEGKKITWKDGMGAVIHILRFGLFD